LGHFTKPWKVGLTKGVDSLIEGEPLKIIIMSDEARHTQVEFLLTDISIHEPEIEIQTLELKRTGIGLYLAQEVLIYVATGFEHVMLAKIMEAGIKWGQKVIPESP
jgi:hypothetical protein